MKLFILCVCLAAFVAVQAAPTAEEEELLKRLVRLLEGEGIEKRYLYTTPKTNKTRPGELWVDLQSVVEVEKDCPDCRLYVVYQCVSTLCHNKAVNVFPEDGYSWERFKEVFIDRGNGQWVSGLEDGMEYQVWDVVKNANGDIYSGYNNSERPIVTIPK